MNRESGIVSRQRQLKINQPVCEWSRFFHLRFTIYDLRLDSQLRDRRLVFLGIGIRQETRLEYVELPNLEVR